MHKFNLKGVATVSFRILSLICVLQLVEDWNIDAESHSFTKLDPDSEADKAVVNKYLLWEGNFGGKAVKDGKIFK